MSDAYREIPFNYTSADDRQVVLLLLGADVWLALERLRARRVTGRSARLLMRLIGDLFVLRRNPYLYQDLVDADARRNGYVRDARADLAIITTGAAGDADVTAVVAALTQALAVLEREIANTPARQRRLRRHLAPIVGERNLAFDPFSLVTHATDATDWRLHLPVAVITPEREEDVAPLLAECARLGLRTIPRGGGTGLTGGAVPLRTGIAMINTEKLNRIHGITARTYATRRGPVAAAAIRLGAGVITEAAMHEAAQHGWVFATDPTSAWASTIGGNIAENAGGKTAVQWGTAVDNLLSWTMAMPDGSVLTIGRVDHPLARILPDDEAVFAVTDAQGRELRRIAIPGHELRRRGLGKDITNKALRGLPGLQKEGTDGVITGAEFVLHRAYPLARTFCVEFYGASMDEAGAVILALAREFTDQGAEVLTALEHFDEQYVKAIGYRNKAPRAEVPKAVLLIDLNGHDEQEMERGSTGLRNLLAPYSNTCLFQAGNAEEARHFWADRKKMGAIARRTNAFKLNEDIVLPLDQLVAFTRRVEAFNLAEERVNQRETVAALLALTNQGEDGLAPKRELAHRLADEMATAIDTAEPRALGEGILASRFAAELARLFAGYDELLTAIAAEGARWRARLVVVATHMHAGDGNVHVNIPVFSNDRWMMQRAIAAAEAMMDWAVEHGGVVSGEHGIGITKYHHLEPERVRELASWRDQIDPQRLINPGKLEDGSILACVFTPSFNLLELEARILQHGSLEQLAEKISPCIRCGRCKPDCCMFSPAQGLFYHPRNKNLALGALIEAILYEVQRRRSACFEPLRWLREIADHCTICHKCLKPCPVEIDTGVVTVLEREVLAAHGVARKPLVTRLTLDYLESRSPTYNTIFRTGMLRLGGLGQRTASAVANAIIPERSRAWEVYPLPLLKAPLHPSSSDELFDILPEVGPNQCLVLYPAEPRATVFYFPGCGSERLFSDIGKAALWLLGTVGATVVLPPPRLCCGYPHHANASPAAGRIELRDAVILGQIQRMMSHLTFDAGVVTCGTCREALHHLGAQDIFSVPFQDVAAFVRSRGLVVPAGADCLYHAPCHDSLAGEGLRTIAALGRQATVVPACCSEAGTLALSRPDIAGALRERKGAALRAAHGPGTIDILTNCPSCIQGLGRNAAKTEVRPKHVAVDLAERAGGPDWAKGLAAIFPRIEQVAF